MKRNILMGIFLVFILLANVSLASYSTVTMEVVEEPICSIELGQNSKFEKKLINKNLTNKEVTLQLQVTNQELASKPTGEIILVLDNSDSMKQEISKSITRKDLIFESAKTLISNLLKDNTHLKIGLVSFSSNLDMSKEGTIADATVVAPLSNNISELTNAISSIEANGPRTNLQAGLSLGSEQFSKESNTNKYMIVLTDGVPNLAIDYDKKYYSDDVINKTNNELQALIKNNIKLTTMLTGITDESYIPTGATKSFGQIITEIFGTQEKPTAGDFYYVTDDQIEETITNDIYNSLIPIYKSFTDITIVDYFPEEIVKNFDFAYVTEANIGNISTKIDTTNNSITWTIPELAIGQTATVQYKLKLKENFDSSIINKIINTNKKVDINYKDFEETEQTKTSDISPKIKLTEPPAVLPKAGTITMVIAITISVGLLVFSIIKLADTHRKMN